MKDKRLINADELIRQLKAWEREERHERGESEVARTWRRTRRETILHAIGFVDRLAEREKAGAP